MKLPKHIKHKKGCIKRISLDLHMFSHPDEYANNNLWKWLQYAPGTVPANKE